MNCVFKTGTANLYCCSSDEYDDLKRRKKNFSALLCAKHPYHKDIVGYEGNLSKDHPEYLYAYRPEEHIMVLNMVDANEEKYFSDEMINRGISFISACLSEEQDVVVVCNKGISRSPTMCLMFLMSIGYFDEHMMFEDVEMCYKKISEGWKPNSGILKYAKSYWNKIREEDQN